MGEQCSFTEQKDTTRKTLSTLLDFTDVAPFFQFYCYLRSYIWAFPGKTMFEKRNGEIRLSFGNTDYSFCLKNEADQKSSPSHLEFPKQKSKTRQSTWFQTLPHRVNWWLLEYHWTKMKKLQEKNIWHSYLCWVKSTLFWIIHYQRQAQVESAACYTPVPPQNIYLPLVLLEFYLQCQYGQPQHSSMCLDLNCEPAKKEKEWFPCWESHSDASCAVHVCAREFFRML